MWKWKLKEKGFTLIEVIISISIFGILAIPLTSMLHFTMKTNQHSKEIFIASQLAQSNMERLKVSENLNNETMTSIDNNTSLHVETIVSVQEKASFEAFPLYKITVIVKDKNGFKELIRLVSLEMIE